MNGEHLEPSHFLNYLQDYFTESYNVIIWEPRVLYKVFSSTNSRWNNLCSILELLTLYGLGAQDVILRHSICSKKHTVQLTTEGISQVPPPRKGGTKVPSTALSGSGILARSRHGKRQHSQNLQESISGSFYSSGLPYGIFKGTCIIPPLLLLPPTHLTLPIPLFPLPPYYHLFSIYPSSLEIRPQSPGYSNANLLSTILLRTEFVSSNNNLPSKTCPLVQ